MAPAGVQQQQQQGRGGGGHHQGSVSGRGNSRRRTRSSSSLSWTSGGMSRRRFQPFLEWDEEEGKLVACKRDEDEGDEEAAEQEDEEQGEAEGGAMRSGGFSGADEGMSSSRVEWKEEGTTVPPSAAAAAGAMKGGKSTIQRAFWVEEEEIRVPKRGLLARLKRRVWRRRRERRREEEEAGLSLLDEWPWLRYGKSRRQFRWQCRLECWILRYEWPWVGAALLAEYLGAVASNLTHYLVGHFYHTYYHDTTDEPGPLPDLMHIALAKLFHASPGPGGGGGLGLLPAWVPRLLPACLIALLGLSFVLVPLLTLVFNIPWSSRRHDRLLGLRGRDHLRPVLLLPVPCVLVLKRVSVAVVIIQVLRSIALPLTLSPSPSPSCRLGRYSPVTLHDAFLDPARAVGPRHPACGTTLLYSSALAHGLVAVLALHTYYPRAFFLRLCSWVLLVAVLFLSLLLRATYTSDALMGLYVAGAVWALLPPEKSDCLETHYGLRMDVRVRGAGDDDEEGGGGGRRRPGGARGNNKEEEGREEEEEDGHFYYLPAIKRSSWRRFEAGGVVDMTGAERAYLRLPW